MKTVVYEIIKDYNFTSHQTEDVVNLLKSESGKYISSATHKIIKNRLWLIITPISTRESNHILINEPDIAINFEPGILKVQRLPVTDNRQPIKNRTSELTEMVDAKNISFPLLLRKWRQGDYFYPLGMQKKKKLSKFFIDQKMSLTEKEKTWVIESNKKIIWIIGRRIDDRFKITVETKNILLIGFNTL